MTLQRRSLRSAPAVLNTSDKAVWVTGWNEAVDALEAELAQAVEPVAWLVYVAEVQNQYVVDDIDDPQLVDDCTNHNAEVTPLYTHPAPPATGERAELIEQLRALSVTMGDVQKSADMLEADAYQLKNAHATIAGLMIDAEAQQVAVPFIKHPNPAHHTSDFATEHLRDVVEYAKGINAALELWIASAQSGVTTTPCPVVYTKTRAIEKHHGIGAKPDHTDWSAA